MPSKGHSEEDSRSRIEAVEEELDGKHHHRMAVYCACRGRLLQVLCKVISEITTLESISVRHTSLKAWNWCRDLDSVRQDGWKRRKSREQKEAYRSGNAEEQKLLLAHGLKLLLPSSSAHDWVAERCVAWVLKILAKSSKWSGRDHVRRVQFLEVP